MWKKILICWKDILEEDTEKQIAIGQFIEIQCGKENPGKTRVWPSL